PLLLFILSYPPCRPYAPPPHPLTPPPLPPTSSLRLSSPPLCHSESAPLHLVIPNPLPSTLSFRIRFSGANIRGPAHCHSESALAVRACPERSRRESAFPANRFGKRGVPRVSPLLRRGIPALIETDSYQG